MVERIPLSCGDRPVEGEGHDQDEAIQAVSDADLGMPKPRDLKSENIGSMPHLWP